MAPLTPAGLITEWSGDGLLLLPVALVAGYLLLVGLAHRKGTPWPVWRTLVFLAGSLVLAWSTNGAPTAYRGTLNWMGTLSVGLTTAVAPLGLALGDPIGLWEEVRGRQFAWMRGRVARALMFPVVASVVASLAVTLTFTTGWYAAARTSTGSWWLLQVTVLVVGLLVNLPLLSEDLLPAWCTPGLRTLFAFTDGIADAVPGLVVLTTIDWVAGGALLAAAEGVGVPMIGAIMIQWMRADAEEAREVDARLDRLEAARAHSAEGASGDAPDILGPAVDRPWWESDPEIAHRFRRPPATG